MEIAWILAALFLFCTMAFVAFALFLPEWVGIQGKKAKEIENSHRIQTTQNTDESHPSKPENTDKK